MVLKVTGTERKWTFPAVMRETYLTFARWSALISIMMWSAALLFSVLGL